MDTNHVDVQPQELARAHQGWENFTRMSTYAGALVVGILVLMGIFLV